MSLIQDIVRRIFAGRELPQNGSREQTDTFFEENFPKWITEFEEGGFLEKTKLEPIRSEVDFLDKLQEHKDDLLVIKFWKHGCIPCLSIAETYKAAEERCNTEGKRVHWFSVDTKALSTRQLVEYQIIAGTPTLQTFTGCKQVGEEIRATNMEELMREIYGRLPSGGASA